MIKEFQGEYRWLSNFATVDVYLDGVVYRSVEHAYMSAKSTSREWKLFCERMVSPGDVKRGSQHIQLVKNWDDIRLDVMRRCIDQKFNNPVFKKKLLATGDLHIQEGNTWGDKFWGVCLKTNEGENNLGKLIMAKRDALQKEAP